MIYFQEPSMPFEHIPTHDNRFHLGSWAYSYQEPPPLKKKTPGILHAGVNWLQNPPRILGMNPEGIFRETLEGRLPLTKVLPLPAYNSGSAHSYLRNPYLDLPGNHHIGWSSGFPTPSGIWETGHNGAERSPLLVSWFPLFVRIGLLLGLNKL